MLKRVIALVLASLGVTAVLAASASAQQYPPRQLAVSVPGCPAPGQTTTATVTGFAPGTLITLTFDGSGPVGSATADASGRTEVPVTIPANAGVGQHTLTATGIESDGTRISVSTKVDVAADGRCPSAPAVGAPTGGLPRTGGDSTLSLFRAGLALAALGGVLLALAAKRRKRAASATA